MNCPNCKARLSCGCQRRTASNGAAVCSRCIGAYEKNLKEVKKIQRPSPHTPQLPHEKISNQASTEPVILSVAYIPQSSK